MEKNPEFLSAIIQPSENFIIRPSEKVPDSELK